MKKALFIMAAALLMMTQCRKENAAPNMPADGAVKMTVTAGPGRTDINTATGAITWSEGDRLYVSDGTNWLGSLTLEEGAGTANGTFTGNVTGLDDEGDACHFFYLGHDNGMEEPTASSSDPVSISFAAQDGTLDGAMKYHAGYGRTDVTVTEGEATGSVIMNTKIAIAHINFTDGTTAYTGAVTMGGTGVSNTLSVSPDGSFSGGDDGGIAIGNGNGTTGERFVTLIPTGTTDVLNVAFTGDATGSMTFANGIQANKFYGMKDAVKVTVTEPSYLPGEFSVSGTTKVKFSKGNLYWDGTDSKWKFEANQWDFSVGEWNESTENYNWDASHVSHFFWSNTTDWQTSGKEPYASKYSHNTQTTSDVFFTNATETTANTDFHVNGETGENKWRTLSKDEWGYLLNTRTNASSLRAWKELDDGEHKGLVILPDDTENPSAVMGRITSTSHLATSGAVFLPAAGGRLGTDVVDVGSGGYYWSGTPYEGSEGNAYGVNFNSGDVSVLHGYRYYGFSVRLVR